MVGSSDGAEGGNRTACLGVQFQIPLAAERRDDGTFWR